MEEMLPTGAQTAPKMSQKEAVYSIVTQVSNSTGVSVADVKNSEVKTVEKKQAVIQMKSAILDALKSGQIVVKSEMTDSKLKTYAGSLLLNWLKRDKRFN